MYFIRFLNELKQIYNDKSDQPFSEWGPIIMDKWIHY